MIRVGSVFYDTVFDKICVVRGFGFDEFGQAAVLYGTLEKQMIGKNCLLTSSWIFWEHFIKIGEV